MLPGADRGAFVRPAGLVPGQLAQRAMGVIGTLFLVPVASGVARPSDIDLSEIGVVGGHDLEGSVRVENGKVAGAVDIGSARDDEAAFVDAFGLMVLGGGGGQRGSHDHEKYGRIAKIVHTQYLNLAKMRHPSYERSNAILP